MNEIDKTNLTDQTKFRLNEITKIENNFNSDYYIDKILIVLSATRGGVCIASHTTVVGAAVGIASVGFTIAFSLATEIIKKLLSTTRNKKKKHDKIFMLAKSKLNSIETLVSQALIELEISHLEFITILKEKDNYEKMKESVRNVSEKQENMGLSSVNSRT